MASLAGGGGENMIVQLDIARDQLVIFEGGDGNSRVILQFALL